VRGAVKVMRWKKGGKEIKVRKEQWDGISGGSDGGRWS